MNGEKENQNKLKWLKSPLGTILITALVAALVGGFLGEPVKNFINRPGIEVEVVSIQSTTPPKSEWLLVLSSSVQQKLAMDIAGGDWARTVRSNNVKYGEVLRRRKSLKQFHESFLDLSKHPAWTGDSKTDTIAFYQVNRAYIRTILEYVQNFSDVSSQDRRTAESFLKQDQGLSSFFKAFAVEPPRNTAEIIRFAGQLQSAVRDKTHPFLEALTEAEREALIEPVPSFNVTLDVTNTGNLPTSIGAIGSLRIRPPRDPNNEIVAVLTLKGDLNKVAVFVPGQRQRLQFSAELKLIPEDKAVTATVPPEYANRLAAIHKKQYEALKVLAPLYKSGVFQCRITLPWGKSQTAEALGTFGEAQALDQLETVLGTRK